MRDFYQSMLCLAPLREMPSFCLLRKGRRTRRLLLLQTLETTAELQSGNQQAPIQSTLQQMQREFETRQATVHGCVHPLYTIGRSKP